MNSDHAVRCETRKELRVCAIVLGADPAAVDRIGNTARDYAATHKRREVLERIKSFPGRCPLTGC